MNTTAKRTVTTLTRYHFLKSVVFNGVHYLAGSIVLCVVNDAGEHYTVTLRKNKVHSCTCEGNAVHHKRCYHITDCVARENARAKREKAAREELAVICEAIREALVSDAEQFAPVAATNEQLVPSCDLATTQLEREVEAICAEAERGQVVPEVAPVLAPVVPEIVPEVAPVVAARKAVPARDLAPLNGNQGFSFMRQDNTRRRAS
jgi:hypothetical protein